MKKIILSLIALFCLIAIGFVGLNKLILTEKNLTKIATLLRKNLLS